MTVLPKQFLDGYAQHRAAEGRGYAGDDLLALPYLKTGPHAKQWAVRARSFDAFLQHVVMPMAVARPLRILDLGAGNGWLSHRLARAGHEPVALDIRADKVDGLGAAREFLATAPNLFECVEASFDRLPFYGGRFDIAVFNASLHYATDLGRTLAEAVRVTRSGGIIAILDSPFYRCVADGEDMVREKRREGTSIFGVRADVLLAQGFIEYLTRERLRAAAPELSWSRRRVLYPLWYELRPFRAWIAGRRRPSRFDLWTARAP